MTTQIEHIEGVFLNNLNRFEHIPLSPLEEYNTFKLYKETHDIQLRNKICNANLKFVVSIANKYTGEVPRADLISEGSLGVMHAIELFDYEAGTRFITYARDWIRKYIQEYLKKYKRSINSPSKKSFEEINVSFISVDGSAQYDVSLKNIDVITNHNAELPDDQYNVLTLEKLFTCLTPTEITYLEHYFGLNDKEKLTIVEITELYGNGKSKERIRQIIEKSKNTLKEYLLKRNITDIIYK